MTKRYILIVAEGCGGCEEARKQVEGDNRIEVLDVTKSLYAADIIRQLGIYKVPLIVEVDEKTDKVCALDDASKPVCAKASTLVKDNG